MSENVKATIVGTVIIGVFLIICTRMATNAAYRTVENLKDAARIYVEAQKVELKRIVKTEKKKAKEVYLKAAEAQSK